MASESYRSASAILCERAATWPEAASPVARVFVGLLRCADLIAKQSGEFVVARGLTFAEFEALAALRSAPPPHELTPGDVRRSFFITSGGLSKILAGLSARGLVSRGAAEGDRREKPVRLSAKGRSLIEAVMADVLGADAVLIAGALTIAEAASLEDLVGRLLAAAELRAPKEEDSPT